MNSITASKLYDYIQCPHKVWRDVYGPQDEKLQEVNPFVQLLWEKGVKHEEKIVSTLGEYLDLHEGSLDERFKKTVEAMENKVPLIYQGVIKYENLLGIPDLIKLLPDNTYMPVDIKSGAAYEGADEETDDEGKPKKHYAVQLCLYNDILKKLGFASHDSGKIIDINCSEVEYELKAPKGARSVETWWDIYENIKANTGLLLENEYHNKPASAGICKLCPWYSSCKKWCEDSNDLSKVFYVGRSVRDRISEDLLIDDLAEFVDIDIDRAMKQKAKENKEGNKSFLYRVGESSLATAKRRAVILTQTKKPVIYEPIVFPKVSYELYFDIESDPTQDFVYLHGVYERHGDEERFIDFTATEISEEAEKTTWAKFWEYIDSLPQDDFSVYYYSAYEKTAYKHLQKKYPDVISAEEVEEFFDNPNVIDLYKVVLSKTDWPVGSYSIKAIAVYLGFKWRDETPSGALSIQWFNEFVESKDEKILKRILEYNEDDCIATMVLKDGIEKLQSSD